MLTFLPFYAISGRNIMNNCTYIYYRRLLMELYVRCEIQYTYRISSIECQFLRLCCVWPQLFNSIYFEFEQHSSNLLIILIFFCFPFKYIQLVLNLFLLPFYIQLQTDLNKWTANQFLNNRVQSITAICIVVSQKHQIDMPNGRLFSQ